jgi:hypothetical protein
MYRQGDVLIVPTTEPVRGQEVAREDGRLILAHGEATGHAHAILSRRAVMFRPDDMPAGGGLLSVSAGGADLVHEEHATIKIPEGTYRVVRQREWTAGDARQVAD